MRTTLSAAPRSVTCRKDALNRLLWFALALLLGLTSLAAHAVDESDLLPPEQAFPLTVSLSGPTSSTNCPNRPSSTGMACACRRPWMSMK